MSIENSGYDVVEMDFPEYTEEFPPVSGAAVTGGTSFSANKTEIYRRNREIAAEMQSEVLAAKEQAKAEKIARLESIYEESAAVTDSGAVFGRRARYVFPVLIAVFAVVIAVLVMISVQSSVRLDQSQAAAESASEAAAAMVIPETETVTRTETTKITSAETEVIITEEIAGEETEMPQSDIKTTAVREPFEQTGTAFVYNTEAMSYRFMPHYKMSQYDQPRLIINVTIKNLTNYDYAVVPHFVITLGETKIYTSRDFYEENSSTYDYSTRRQYFPAEELVNGEWVETGKEFAAFDFDKNHLFSLTLDFSAMEFGVFENFKYDPLYRTNSEYSERADEGFEIPFEELKRYIFEDFPDE